MSCNRIIFLRQDRYSKYDHDRMGFDFFQKRGFSVEFWDCSEIFLPEIQEEKNLLESDSFSGLRCFEKRNSLFNSISRLTSQDSLILGIGYNIKTWSVLRHIADTKALLGMQRLGNLPVPIEESSFQGRLEKIIRRPSVVANFLLQKIPLVKLGLRPLDFIVQGGAATLLAPVAHLKGKRTKILNAHSFDYDRYLLSLSNKVVDVAENVVFLDDGGPFHRDQYIFNTPFPCSAEEYFSNLNSFFRVVEKKFNCSVLVASHPRVQYNKIGNPFEGRRIVEGETHNLVKNSKFVLSTCSSSVNFPIIHKKPIVFLAINPTKRNHYDLMTKSFAANLGKLPVQWADKDRIDWELELAIDRDCYSQYLEVYIKKRGSPEKLICEILADYLTSIAN